MFWIMFRSAGGDSQLKKSDLIINKCMLLLPVHCMRALLHRLLAFVVAVVVLLSCCRALLFNSIQFILFYFFNHPTRGNFVVVMAGS